MTFYLKPPRGEINLHKLEDCVKQRLICYDYLCNGEVEISNFDCLIEDNVLDRTGHYLFRLKAYRKHTFQSIFLKNEIKLLQLRMSCYGRSDLKSFLSRLLKHTKDGLREEDVHETVKEMYVVLQDICHCMLRKKYLNHIFENSHNDVECKKFLIKVPFRFCASLICNREFNIHRGFVEISCNGWKKLVFSLYETHLRKVLVAMRYSKNVQMTINDDRIKQVLLLIRTHWFKSNANNNVIKLKFDIKKIDEESKLFPLCMLNLYKVLQKTNRLSHNDRFDFSLYMKGIGVSLTDSMKFWENAYSKEHSTCSRCTHSWQENERRYIYGIRHLYGLEGSRRNYQVRSCSYLQEKSVGPAECGGCPFKHFDDNNLRKALKKLLVDKDDDIEVMIYERKENPTVACKLFYETIFKTVANRGADGELNFQNPVEYYESLRKKIDESNGDSGIGASFSLPDS